MIFITRLYIKNFGPIREKEFIFHHNKINLISGRNAVGKTQLSGAILFSILGESVVNFDKKSNLQSIVKLRLSNGDEEVEIISLVKIEGNEKVVYQEVNPSGSGIFEILKESLTSRSLPSFLKSELNTHHLMKDQEQIEYKNVLSDIGEIEFWEKTTLTSGNINPISVSMTNLIGLLRFYNEHRKSKIKFPLVVDIS